MSAPTIAAWTRGLRRAIAAAAYPPAAANTIPYTIVQITNVGGAGAWGSRPIKGKSMAADTANSAYPATTATMLRSTCGL